MYCTHLYPNGLPESKSNISNQPIYHSFTHTFRSGQSTAVGEERLDLSTSLVDVLNGRNGIQVVDTRVKLRTVIPHDATSEESIVELTPISFMTVIPASLAC